MGNLRSDTYVIYHQVLFDLLSKYYQNPPTSFDSPRRHHHLSPGTKPHLFNWFPEVSLALSNLLSKSNLSDLSKNKGDSVILLLKSLQKFSFVLSTQSKLLTMADKELRDSLPSLHPALC